MKKIKNISGITISLCAILLAGCGSSDGDSNESSTSTGTFIDAAVTNINYETETHSGVTDDEGQFNYETGETVTFSIGNITFPSVTASGTITPLTLANTDDVENQTVINISRFLQTIDSDGDPSNGISISDDLKNANSTNGDTIDFTVDSDTFESSTLVQAVISDAGADELVSESSALTHLESSLTDEGVTADYEPSLYGTWYRSDDDGFFAVTFLDDNTYFAAELDCDNDENVGTETGSDAECTYKGVITNSSSDDDGSGFEFARYTDDNNEIVHGDIGYDDNGTSGLSTTVASDNEDESADYSHITYSFDDSDTLVLNITEHSSDDNTDQNDIATLYKQVNTTDNPLIGTWLSSSHNKISSENSSLEDELDTFIFTNDGHYFDMESESNSESGASGLEVGTYKLTSWVTTTNSSGKTVYTATLTPTLIDDLNEDLGFFGDNDVPAVGYYSPEITIVGDTMTMVVETESFEYKRQ